MERTQVDEVVDVAAELAGKADQVDEVLVIYSLKDKGGPRAMDNGIDVATAIFLMRAFEHWLLQCLSQPQREP